MQESSITPVVEGLESRLFLSTAPGTLSAPTPDLHAIIPLKKEGSGGKEEEDKKDEKEAKGNKKNRAPEITVLLNGVSLADNTASIDFGRVTAGDAGPTRTFAIRNDGKGALSIGSVSLPAGFSLLDAPAAGLDKGDTTTFTVRLDTAAAASRSGQIQFATNDADENPFNFPLRGTVAAPPTPELSLLQGTRAIASAGFVNFGSAAAGTRPTRTLTIRNDG